MGRRDLVGTGTWSVAFVAAGFLGRATIIDEGALSLIWPAAGIALLWLVATPREHRRQNVAALALATFCVNFLTGASFTLSALLVVTNLVQVLLFLRLVEGLLPDIWGFGGARPIERLADLGRIVGAALVACAVAAVLGVSGVELTTGTGSFLGYLVWWGRNVVGLVVVGLIGPLAGPSISAARRTPHPVRALLARVRPPSRARAVEALLLVAATAGTYAAAFLSSTGSSLAFLLLLPTFWVGIRFTPLATTVHGLACAGAAVGFTISERGPFVEFEELAVRAFVSQVCIAMIMIAGLALAFSNAQERRVAIDLRAMVAASRGAVLVSTDTDGVVRSFGGGAERLLGHRAGAVVGERRFTDFVDADELGAVSQELGVAPEQVLAELARRQAVPRGWWLDTADGGRVHVRMALSELRDSWGQLQGTLVIAVDQTRAMLDSQKLAADRARWDVLLDHLPGMAVLTVDEDLVLRAVAGSGVVQSGLAGHVGRPLTELATEENNEVLRAIVRDALRGETVAVDVVGGNSGLDMSVAATAVPPVDGRPEVLLVIRDTTAERAREKAITIARDRAEQLFTAAPQGIGVLDAAGVLVRVNPALCAMLGKPESEVVGTTLVSYGADRRRNGVAEMLRRTLAGSVQEPSLVWQVHGAGPGHRALDVSMRRLEGLEADDAGVVLANVVDVSEQEELRERLAHLAHHDPLTGLANRRRFEEELEAHLRRCARNGPNGAVLVLDLDHFKAVNDTLGHRAGDALLVLLADALRKRVRGSDLIARLGGDEFGVLLVRGDLRAAEALALDLVEVVRTAVAGLDHPCDVVTVSVGVVTFDGRGSTEIMSAADDRMYAAKAGGRDQYVAGDEGAPSLF